MSACDRSISFSHCGSPFTTRVTPASLTRVARAIAGPTETRQPNCTFSGVKGWFRRSAGSTRSAREPEESMNGVYQGECRVERVDQVGQVDQVDQVGQVDQVDQV
jgi:hypothetical protein